MKPHPENSGKMVVNLSYMIFDISDWKRIWEIICYSSYLRWIHGMLCNKNYTEFRWFFENKKGRYTMRPTDPYGSQGAEKDTYYNSWAIIRFKVRNCNTQRSAWETTTITRKCGCLSNKCGFIAGDSFSRKIGKGDIWRYNIYIYTMKTSKSCHDARFYGKSCLNPNFCLQKYHEPCFFNDF